MTKPVLTTRCIGQATHYSGHPLAPMEYVFECEEPARSTFWQRFARVRLRPQQAIMLGTWALLGFGVFRAAIYLATGDDLIR